MLRRNIADLVGLNAGHITAPVASHDAERKILRLNREIARVREQRAKKEMMLDRLQRFEAILAKYTLSEHRHPLPIRYLRSHLRPNNFVHMEHSGGSVPPIDRFKTAHWFDFRRLPTDRADDMIDFGKDLVDRGLVRLPFDACVFVFPYVCPDGQTVASACLLRQDANAIVAEGVIHVTPQGLPLGLYGPDMPPNDPIFYAMAVLSSRSVVQRQRSVKSEAEVPDTYRGDSYFEVAIRPRFGSVGAANGHASPRLHWRRGHIRHLGNRTTWVRATLVGKASNGVVIHDYAI